MSIFDELRDDFHYYVGRKLGLSQNQINNGLSGLVGKPTNFYGHYNVLKVYAGKNIKRAFVIEMLKFKIAEFMGTQIFKDQYSQIEKAAEKIELERLEFYMSFLFDPDSDWNQWRKMMNEFGLNTPSEHVDLVAELKRLYLPVCFANKINPKAIKFYSPDRKLRNLALVSLNLAKHNPEIETAIKIQTIFLDNYYREMGIELQLKDYDGNIFTRKKNNYKLTILPFLPKLPSRWYYTCDFYERTRNIVRAEHNLFKIEWDFIKVLRLSHHNIIINTLDRCSNDILECVTSVKELLLMDPSIKQEQEQALILLRGDAGECIISNFYDVAGFTSEKEHDFISQWYARDPFYVVCSILKSYNNAGDFDKKKMGCFIKSRFRSRPHQLKKLKRGLCW